MPVPVLVPVVVPVVVSVEAGLVSEATLNCFGSGELPAKHNHYSLLLEHYSCG